MSPLQPGVLLTVAGLAVVLAATRRHNLWVELGAKAVASTGFILVALAAGATTSTWGQWVLAALCLSWLGDVLLVLKTRPAFLAGLVAFLLGHVAYAAGFLSLGIAPVSAALALAALGVVAAFVMRWLMPHVEAPMRAPVVAYVSVITLMVAGACGAVASGASPLLAVAAIAFFLSDLAVARQRFVHQAFANRLVGLPLYYGAQLLFAALAAPT